MNARKKNVMVMSALLWFAATVICCAFAILAPGLDIARKYDDYSKYWDFRLSFFVIRWLISIPIWGFATWLVILTRDRKSA
jgi:hypothetical protein